MSKQVFVHEAEKDDLNKEIERQNKEIRILNERINKMRMDFKLIIKNKRLGGFSKTLE